MIHPPAPVVGIQIPVEERTLFAQRRAAIDEIATTRAKVIRCGLFGTYLFRPNPLREDTVTLRDHWIAEMRVQYDGLTRACALIDGHDPEKEFPQEICDWLASCAADHCVEADVLRDMTRKTLELVEADPVKTENYEKMLTDHAVFGRLSLFPAISLLCDGFWSDLDRKRHAEVQQAKETGEAIGTTLRRLEHIGKHVKLVSLNASVEAARVGDAGKGLGVIAQEFKSLAEEIQHLANSAKEDIVGMTRTRH